MKGIKLLRISNLLLATGALMLGANLAQAAAGQTSGNFTLDKKGTLFNIGNANAGGSLWTNGYVYTSHNKSNSYQHTNSTMDLDARFLKKTLKVLDSNARTKIWREPTANGGSTSRWELEASVKVLGLATVVPPSWPQANGEHYGDTGVKNHTMNFFSASASYPISIVTLTVSGSAGGSVGVRARSYKKWVNNATYMQDFGQSFVYSGANISGRGSVSAGIPWLAEAGVTASVNIINGWVNSDSWGDRIEYWNNPAAQKVLYRANTRSDAAASLGAGKLELWFKAVGINVARETLASWGGYTIASRNLFNQGKEEFFAK
jgi:hypothetical protein